MKDYSKVTFLEYMKKKKAIMDKLGRVRGNCTCVSCYECPFKIDKDCNGIEMDNPIKALEVVMEYEIPVDWKNVPIDTPIYVRDKEDDKWFPRHFAGYEGGRVTAWDAGGSSFTTRHKSIWQFAKLKD